MTVPLSAKFFNQVYIPANQLIVMLASHPFAIEPQSNILLHQFEGVVLHTNHFAEKNGISIKIDSQFRDLANSIKHIRHEPDKQINIQSAIIYEINKNKFRFIRNTILAQYLTSNIEFDAVEKLCDVIKTYLPQVNLNDIILKIPESTYPFYEWAIAYNKDELSTYTESISILCVRKELDKYIRLDPTELKILALKSDAIGKNPESYYPNT